jgi:hypothetical protein
MKIASGKAAPRVRGRDGMSVTQASGNSYRQKLFKIGKNLPYR